MPPAAFASVADATQGVDARSGCAEFGGGSWSPMFVVIGVPSSPSWIRTRRTCAGGGITPSEAHGIGVGLTSNAVWERTFLVILLLLICEILLLRRRR